MDEEGLQDTANRLIHIGRSIPIDEVRFFKQLEELNQESKHESAYIRDLVKQIVTTYHPEEGGEGSPDVSSRTEALRHAAERIDEA